jgi:hypothetical protein
MKKKKPKLEEASLMQNKDGVQKGPQDHAEGQHGSKTRSKILEQLHSGNGNGTKPDTPEVTPIPPEHKNHIAHHNSAHRLFEERKQHDEAEKNSEKTRLHREVERRHLDPNHIPKI